MTINPTIAEDLRTRFSHPQDGREYDLIIDDLYSMGRDLAEEIVKNTPVSREQSLAITRLDECVQYAILAHIRRSES